MIIQEPIKAAIKYNLDNLSYCSAIFLAERLHAELNSDESFYCLAEAHFRAGKANVAFSLFEKANHNVICNQPRCIYLYAMCCYVLDKNEEAHETLAAAMGGKFTVKITKKQLLDVFGELSSFAALLYGKIQQRMDFASLAVYYYGIALSINPMLWEAYEKLVQLDPSSVNCSQIFSKDNFDLRFSCGTNPLINLLNKIDSADGKDLMPAPQHELSELSENRVCKPQQNYLTPQQSQGHQQPAWNMVNISSPFAVIKQCSEKLDIFTPEVNGDWKTTACYAPAKVWNAGVATTVANVHATPRSLRKSSNDALKSVNKNDARVQPTFNSMEDTFLSTSKQQHPVIESQAARRLNFGVLQVSEEALDRMITMQNRTTQTPATTQLKRHNTRRTAQELSKIDSTGVSPGSLRRSSRLYSSPHNVKENATDCGGVGVVGNKSKTSSRVGVNRRARKTINFDTKLIEENSHSEEKMAAIVSGAVTMMKATEAVCKVDVTKTGVRMQLQSAYGMIDLICKLAQAYQSLCLFRCKEAIDRFNRLPEAHLKSGFVLSCIGKAYFEQSKYNEAAEYYRMCHELEPHRLDGMEYYSSALWHLQKEVELSCLAQELVKFDKTAPQTWCASGNCFSLQKEHETSIKFLNRAIQVDKNFVYSYTLLGHELVATEELENAMSAFRKATNLNGRHYNAWYGMGMIYYKQEKFLHAQEHYQRALDISPYNPTLMCHLALVLNSNKKSSQAIELLRKASKLDAGNALVRFHLSSIYFTLKEYDQAFEELEQLKKIAPNESMVYFLTGKIFKECGDTQRALENFSWAMSLDPKGATNQIKELIDRQHAPEDVELVVHNANNDSIMAHSIASISFNHADSLNITPRTSEPSGGITGAIASSAHNLLPSPNELEQSLEEYLN